MDYSLAPVLYPAFAAGLAQLPRVLKVVPELAKEQTGNRREIVAILNRLGDALALLCHIPEPLDPADS